jgi:hypothetical protein
MTEDTQYCVSLAMIGLSICVQVFLMAYNKSWWLVVSYILLVMAFGRVGAGLWLLRHGY